MDSDFRPAKRPAKSLPISDAIRSAKTQTPAETNFKTPEQMAAIDDLSAPTEKPAEAAESETKRSWRDKLHWEVLREKKWLASAAVVILCGAVVAFTLGHIGRKPVASAGPVLVRKIPKKPTTVPSNLSGLPVDPSVNQRPVTAVMIENSIDARPQSGLSQAGVVFEAIAEGGVTRFMALYQDQSPDNLGPVRSARPYFIQWSMGYDAGYAHVGGSPDGLNDIKAWGVRDLDEFANAGAYHRISQRVAPHNMYTSMAALNQLEASKGYTSSQFTGFDRKKAAPAKQPTARSINIAISGPVYNVHYDYNSTTNSYNRSEGGAPHIDANTNQQLSPQVVVALIVPESQGALDSSGAYYSNYNPIGSGQAIVFQDGISSPVTWTKADNKSPLKFTDAAGKPFKLNPGQTWITAITAPRQVNSTP